MPASQQLSSSRPPLLLANAHSTDLVLCFSATGGKPRSQATMINTNAWLEELEELRPSPEITDILKHIRLENQTGIQVCTKFCRRRELKSGLYTNTPTSIDLVEHLKVSIDVVHLPSLDC